ncbi:MAG: type II toxin-antitoxin system MqsR family toxin [Proteobacteria bacterium]|nr:type II toxin-antitoxin system MqsR family toxin [Pseudomonadota bacterium]
MEKRLPHYPLESVKALARQGRVRSTATAARDAALVGFDFEEMVAVVMALERVDFHKSMTTYADHSIWQDVYRPATRHGDVYVKLTVISDLLIVSFKEL